MLQHVLVPLDGSELAEKALSYAKQIIDPHGKITLLSVIDVPEYAIAAFYSAGVVPETANRQLMMDKMVPQTHEYLETVGRKIGGITTHREVVIGEAASSIIEIAEKHKVDAIVMSTHGRSGISRWLFGSVTSKVLGEVHCPVFVIPNRKEEA
jgi:nucleotide-binding universal stress UspA family protein